MKKLIYRIATNVLTHNSIAHLQYCITVGRDNKMYGYAHEYLVQRLKKWRTRI